MGSYISIINDTNYPSTTIVLKDIFGPTQLPASKIKPHSSMRNVNKLTLKLAQDLYCGLESKYGRIETRVTVFSAGVDNGVSENYLSSYFPAELAWWRLLEEDDTYNEDQRLLRKLSRFIKFIDDNRKWLDAFIETVSMQEKVVTGVKAGITAAGTAGTAMIFTPLFPVGLVVTAASGLAGFATSIGDEIADSIKRGEFEKKFKEFVKLKENYYLALYDLEAVERELRRRYDLNDASGLALQFYHHVLILGGDVENLIAQIDIYAIILQEASKLVKVGKAIKSVFSAARDAQAILTTAPNLSALTSMTRVFRGLIRTGNVVRSVAVLGAAISVFDLIYTGLSTKDNLKISKALKDELDNILPEERERQEALLTTIYGN